MRRLFSFLLVASCYLLVASTPVFAQALTWDTCSETVDGQKVATLECIPVVIQNLVNFAIAFVGALAVIFIIISGIRYITSGGDPKQVEGAKKTMMYAIIGLIVVILSFFIVNFVATFAGVAGSVIGL